MISYSPSEPLPPACFLRGALGQWGLQVRRAWDGGLGGKSLFSLEPPNTTGGSGACSVSGVGVSSWPERTLANWELLCVVEALILRELGVEGELQNAGERRDMADSGRQKLRPEASFRALPPCLHPLEMQREAGVLDGPS